LASGLAALLDDVAAIAKLAAASLDDVAGAAGKAGAKAVGVVVDDAAVTPRYAIGFTPERELPIIARIALGSLGNKFLILLPAALLLSAFLPGLVTPLLMLGGAYLCYEAAEKTAEALGGHAEPDEPDELALSSKALEREKVWGAIRTDLILSAEIMAISLAQVAAEPLAVQAGALAVVGLALTVGVYGLVGLIVKLDDIGLHLARRRSRAAQRVGEALVRAMPRVLDGLSVAGTAAMLWVGGGIILHGLQELGVPGVAAVYGLAGRVGDTPLAGGLLRWLALAAASAATGLATGAAIFVLALGWRRLRGR
jgi:predicted DNA repair protein MutK